MNNHISILAIQTSMIQCVLACMSPDTCLWIILNWWISDEHDSPVFLLAISLTIKCFLLMDSTNVSVAQSIFIRKLSSCNSSPIPPPGLHDARILEGAFQRHKNSNLPCCSGPVAVHIYQSCCEFKEKKNWKKTTNSIENLPWKLHSIMILQWMLV